jgi:hypothetical protein
VGKQKADHALRRIAAFVPTWVRRSLDAWQRASGRMPRHRRPFDPPRWVDAQAFDPGFDEGDSAYHAVHAAADGRIYFTISTHRADTDACVGCFDPVAQRIMFVESLTSALPRASSGLGQGKIHVPLGELGGQLYFATHLGWSRPRAGRDSYSGFRIMRLNPSNGQLSVLARGPEEEGWISGALDGRRGIMYGLTFPTGRLCRYDIAADRLSVEWPPCVEPPTSEVWRGRPVYPVCRALGLDGEGVLYGATRRGAIWRCAPGEQPRVLTGINVQQGIVPPVSARGRRSSAWRAVVWDGEGRCFYGLHAGTQSLFRYAPRAGRMEPVGRLGPGVFHRMGHAPLRSQLGLTLAGGRILYHIAHGPPAQASGRPLPRTTACLLSWNLATGRFREHGPIRTASGERVLFAESLAVDRTGALYTMGWVEVADAGERRRYARLRSEGSNGECRGEVYRMMLLRIPPATLRPEPV